LSKPTRSTGRRLDVLRLRVQSSCTGIPNEFAYSKVLTGANSGYSVIRVRQEPPAMGGTVLNHSKARQGCQIRTIQQIRRPCVSPAEIQWIDIQLTLSIRTKNPQDRQLFAVTAGEAAGRAFAASNACGRR